MMSVVIAIPGRAAFIFSQISTNFSFLYGRRIALRMRSEPLCIGKWMCEQSFGR